MRSLLAAAAVLALFAAAAWLPGTLGRTPAAVPAAGTRGALGTAAATGARTGAVRTAPPNAPGRDATATATPTAPTPETAGVQAPDIARGALPVPRDIPARAHGPVAAVRDYFFTLACAAVVPEGTPAMGCGEAAFPRAYAYLDGAWQARLPFAKFVAAFAGVLHTDLLVVADAGPVAGSPNERRVFAEVRRIEQIGPRQAVVFAAGVFTVVAARTGWYLVDGSLKPENLAELAYAAQEPARGDPLAVARAAAGLRPDSGAPASFRPQSGPTATVRVQLPGGAAAVVHLVQRVDGIWQVLYIQRA